MSVDFDVNYCRIPDPASRIWDPGTRIMEARSWIPDPGSWKLDPGSRILDPGSRLQGPAYWIKDPGPLHHRLFHIAMCLCSLHAQEDAPSLAWPEVGGRALHHSRLLWLHIHSAEEIFLRLLYASRKPIPCMGLGLDLIICHCILPYTIVSYPMLCYVISYYLTLSYILHLPTSQTASKGNIGLACYLELGMSYPAIESRTVPKYSAMSSSSPMRAFMMMAKTYTKQDTLGGHS